MISNLPTAIILYSWIWIIRHISKLGQINPELCVWRGTPGGKEEEICFAKLGEEAPWWTTPDFLRLDSPPLLCLWSLWSVCEKEMPSIFFKEWVEKGSSARSDCAMPMVQGWHSWPIRCSTVTHIISGAGLKSLRSEHRSCEWQREESSRHVWQRASSGDARREVAASAAAYWNALCPSILAAERQSFKQTVKRTEFDSQTKRRTKSETDGRGWGSLRDKLRAAHRPQPELLMIDWLWNIRETTWSC